MIRPVNISVGAGFENDRRDLGLLAAESLTLFNGPRYLIFECLAERTLAAQLSANDAKALVHMALSFLDPCINMCSDHDIKIVSNFGGADPMAVAIGIKHELNQRGLNFTVAAVLGDQMSLVEEPDEQIIARIAYIGATGIVQALQQGADIVVTGRVADPSLVVGPVVHELNISWDDWDALANATLAGHLIECGTQVSGGYFADKDMQVPDLANVGPPVASISEYVTKLQKPLGGGILNRATVTQQMLYELHDPTSYLTPDVVLDISNVNLCESDDSPNQITVSGAKGRTRPDTLKTLLCRHTGWLAEGEISYVGDTAGERALLAQQVIESRIEMSNAKISRFIGVNDGVPTTRLRMAVRERDPIYAERALIELEALYLNGPAGGGGVRKSLTPMIETKSGLTTQQDLQPVTVELIA